MKSRLLLLLAPALLLAVSMASEMASEDRPVKATFHASPETVQLSGPYDSVQLILTGKSAQGNQVDWTRSAELISEPRLVKVDDRRHIRPVAEGQEVLVFRQDDANIEVPVEVTGLDQSPRVSFVRDVAPVLSRLGCNAGTCHGTAQGKNGFKLSLRGYDPLADHLALTSDLAGRRVDRVSPRDSLFLTKSTSHVPHEGGQVLDPGSTAHRLLLSWIEQGAALVESDPRPVSLRVVPDEATIPLPGMSQQFAVIATFSDGTSRDVTAQAFVESGDMEVVTMDKRGLGTAVRRGESPILVRYEGNYAAARLVVMGDRSDWSYEKTPIFNWIDTLVHAKLRTLRSQPGEVCTDAEFLRRITLDLTGRLPEVESVRVFLMDARPSRTKRTEVIDRLLGSMPYVDHWTNRWASLMQVNSKYVGQQGAKQWREWIRAQVASNTPYDRFVHELLASKGTTRNRPQTAFWRVQREPDLAMESVTQLFLGVRFNCNKCHDHPFERWTQDQHWQLAAFLAQVTRKAVPPKNGNDKDEAIGDGNKGEVTHQRTGQTAALSFPYEHAGMASADAPRREQFATWVTASENQYFTRNYVNRLWAYLTGTGLIEPIDDMRAGNPPTNPKLLERLTTEFVDSGFDVRHILRLICQSRTYQLSTRTNQWNADDHSNYSHAKARRLPAEVLFDAVHQATGSKPALAGQRPGTLAAQLVDSSTKTSDGFLDLFGRPPRESICECERSDSLSLGQALNLVNGPTIANAVEAEGNAIENLVKYEPSDERVLEELYLRFLGRPPSAEEADQLLPSLDPMRRANMDALPPVAMESFVAGFAKWEAEWETKMRLQPWVTPTVVKSHSEGGATIEVAEDGSFRVTGESPDKDRTSLTLNLQGTGFTGLRLEALPLDSLPGKGPGRAENGNFVLGEIEVVSIPKGNPLGARRVKLKTATADFSQADWPVAKTIDGDPATGWAIMPQFGKRHVAVFEAAEDFGQEEGVQLVVTLVQQYRSRYTLGHGRLAVTRSPRPVHHMGLSLETEVSLLTSAEERTQEQLELLHRAFLKTMPTLAHQLRLACARDLAWALANSPSFLFNR
ncbi:MAG TPA: DUF1553 domain-containing protein [Planctomycetes bacterium]|nr:DUF1553 domain-containing protein [Planctomycetota bacterium]